MPIVWLMRNWISIVAGVIVLASIYMAANYFDQSGYDRRSEEVLADMEKVRDEADKRTKDIRKNADDLLEEKDAELKTINSRLISALGELRDRPDRRSQPGLPSSTGTCNGASGAELSGPDAGFLAGEAARGDGLRAALAQCYAQYKKVAEALNTK